MYQAEGKMIIYVNFIVFEAIGKIFRFNSVLYFAILSHFKMKAVIILQGGVCGGEWGGGLLGWFPAS